MSRARNLVLLALVITCGISFWMARRGAESPMLTASPPPPAAPVAAGDGSVPERPLGSVQIGVLNGTDEPGLARRVSRMLAAAGCVVVRVADAPHDTFSRSLLVNRRLARERLASLASHLGRPTTVSEWDPRIDEDVLLVLGSDHERITGALASSP